jgi:hypothetical protein
MCTAPIQLLTVNLIKFAKLISRLGSLNHSVSHSVVTSLIAYGDPSTEAFSHPLPKLPVPYGIDGSTRDYWVTRYNLHAIHQSVDINGHNHHDRSS